MDADNTPVVRVYASGRPVNTPSDEERRVAMAEIEHMLAAHDAYAARLEDEHLNRMQSGQGEHLDLTCNGEHTD